MPAFGRSKGFASYQSVLIFPFYIKAKLCEMEIRLFNLITRTCRLEIIIFFSDTKPQKCLPKETAMYSIYAPLPTSTEAS